MRSESLRDHGRVWVPTHPGEIRGPAEIPEEDRASFLERKYPKYGNRVPCDVASHEAHALCDEDRGVRLGGYGMYRDLRDTIRRLGEGAIAAKYGDLCHMSQQITAEDPYEVPMRGLWVDGKLVSSLPSPSGICDPNFSDLGANHRDACALRQGLAGDCCISPCTLRHGQTSLNPVQTSTSPPSFGKLTGVRGGRSQAYVAYRDHS